MQKFFHLRPWENFFEDPQNGISESLMAQKISENSFYGPFVKRQAEHSSVTELKARRMVLQGKLTEKDELVLEAEGLFISWDQFTLEVGVIHRNAIAGINLSVTDKRIIDRVLKVDGTEDLRHNLLLEYQEVPERSIEQALIKEIFNF